MTKVLILSSCCCAESFANAACWQNACFLCVPRALSPSIDSNFLPFYLTKRRSVSLNGKLEERDMKIHIFFIWAK